MFHKTLAILRRQADFTAFVNAQKNTFIKQVNDMKNEMNAFANNTQKDLIDRLNSIDDKTLQTLSELENGTKILLLKMN